jgi:hypothetical protein
MAREATRDTTSIILAMDLIFLTPFLFNFVRFIIESSKEGKRSVTIKVRILSLFPLACNIFSPGDLFDKLDTPTESLFLQARGMKGFAKDAEDIITFKISHHLVTLPRPDMTSFHQQLEIHFLPRSLFIVAIVIEED